MIAAIVSKYHVKLDPDDPAFILVELNKIALENAAKGVVDKIDSSVATLSTCQELFNKDLANLGQIVTSLETSISNTMDHATFLTDELKKAKAAPILTQTVNQAKEPLAPAFISKTMLVAMFVCGLTSAVLAVGGVVILHLSTIEDARIGRAVNSALPYLESGAKKKLEDAIQKASSR